jgi:LmbE family N-acetylglucosaminyl deacetylase
MQFCGDGSRNQLLAVNGKSALVFAAHQDDETFGCGGVIALKRQQQAHVGIVFLTDGRLGTSENFRSDNIVQVRRREAMEALAILGIAKEEIHFLGEHDGDLQQLSAERRVNLVSKLIELLRSFQPREVYVHYKKDRHADHEAAYNLVSEAIAASGMKVDTYQYPIRVLWQAPLFMDLQLYEIAGAWRLPILAVSKQKKRAIEKYESQKTILPQGFLRQFHLPYEIFFKIEEAIGRDKK